MKKILLLVALFSLLTVSQALAWGDNVEMDQGGINVLATGVSIGAIETSEYEQFCYYMWGESFYWGGLSIDLLGLQGTFQTMEVKNGCADQYFSNYTKLVTPNMYLKMEQNAYQNAHVRSFGFQSDRPR
jgi:hypothetical protein